MGIEQARIEYDKQVEIDKTLREILEAPLPTSRSKHLKNFVSPDYAKPYRLYIERVVHGKIPFNSGDAYSMTLEEDMKGVQALHDKHGCIFKEFNEQKRYNKTVQAKVDNLRDETDVLEGVLSDERALLRVFALKGDANGISTMKTACGASERAINENKGKITKLLMGGQV